MKDPRFSQSDSQRADVFYVLRKTETPGSFAAVFNMFEDIIRGLNGVLAGMQLQPKLVPIPVCVLAPQNIYRRGSAPQQGCK